MNICDKNALMKIIYDLDKNSIFYEWAESEWEEDFYYNHYNDIHDYVDRNFDADLYEGSYKASIVFRNFDLVWKIPFYNTNDAIAEYNFYRNVEEEWKFYFAECDCLGKIEIGNTLTDIIVMERAYVDEDKARTYIIDGIKKQNVLSGNYIDKSDENFEKILYNEFYSLDTEQAFSYLMYDYYDDCNIADYITNNLGVIDFHTGNIGFIGDRPIIIDYAMNSRSS